MDRLIDKLPVRERAGRTLDRAVFALGVAALALGVTGTLL